MTAKKLTLAVATALLFITSSCSSPPEQKWVEGEAPFVSRRVLWEVTRMAFEREGFPQIAPGFEVVENERHLEAVHGAELAAPER